MEAIVIATVTLVWALGLCVAIVAWAIGASLGDTIEAKVATTVRVLRIEAARARIPVRAPGFSVKTPAELREWRAARDALLATAPTEALAGRDRVTPPAEILAAWAAQHMGLRLPSDLAATVVSPAPVAPEQTDLATLVSLPTLDTTAVETTRTVSPAPTSSPVRCSQRTASGIPRQAPTSGRTAAYAETPVQGIRRGTAWMGLPVVVTMAYVRPGFRGMRTA